MGLTKQEKQQRVWDSAVRARRAQNAIWVREDAEIALAVLEHCTTDEFSRGGDKPARDALERILASWI